VRPVGFKEATVARPRPILAATMLATLVFATAAGCGGAATADRDPPPIGKVRPLPAGCLEMEFFAPTDDSRVERGPDERISSIITPIGRHESLIRRFTLGELEGCARTSDPELRMAIVGRGRLALTAIPGPAAWEYVKRCLLLDDELWAFCGLDCGVAVLRHNRLLCLVVTEHNF
jgi:hypothetical protein